MIILRDADDFVRVDRACELLQELVWWVDHDRHHMSELHGALLLARAMQLADESTKVFKS